MTILKLKIGKDYLTRSGLPVRVAVIGQDCMMLQSLASDNLLRVPRHYPLERLRAKHVAVASRPQPYQPHMTKNSPCEPKPLAPIIDALLMEGGRTMKGLAREVKRRASAACRGKDVSANIRARTYWLRKKDCLLRSKSDVTVPYESSGQPFKPWRP